VSIAPSESRIVYAIGGQTLLRSDDFGATWRSLTPPRTGETVTLTSVGGGHADDHVLVGVRGGGGGLFRSHDGGGTWQEVLAGNITTFIQPDFGRLVAAVEADIFISTDDAQSWQALGSDWPGASVRQLVLSGDTLYVSTSGLGFRRQLGGSSPYGAVGIRAT
jgi:photosystem II stability/assembly factor-like uncharacterized protein